MARTKKPNDLNTEKKPTTIRWEITGIAPILFNRFTEEAQESLEKRSQGKTKTKDQYIDEAHTKVYRNGGKEIGIPALNLKKSLLEGAGFAGLKIGRRSAVPFIRATVFYTEPWFSLGVEDADGIHQCAGNIPPGPRGKKAIIRRPYMDTGWKVGGELHIFDARITPDMVLAAMQEAGALAGICDHRPDYGRFVVTRWEAE